MRFFFSNGELTSTVIFRLASTSALKPERRRVADYTTRDTLQSGAEEIRKAGMKQRFFFKITEVLPLLRVLLLLHVVALPLEAQYVVQGVVTDSLTNEPLPYMSVYLKGTSEGTMTNDQGRFSFKTYRPEGLLVISAVGYNEYSRLIHPARAVRLKVALSPANHVLDEVVIKPRREHYKKK